MRFVPALLYAGLIFWMSSQPRLPQAPFLFDGIDKLFHAGEYAILGLLLLFGDRWPVGRRAWGWVAVSLVYAASDEMHQLFVPNRSADVADWVADTSGALIATAIWLKLRGTLRRPADGAQASATAAS